MKDVKHAAATMRALHEELVLVFQELIGKTSGKLFWPALALSISNSVMRQDEPELALDEFKSMLDNSMQVLKRNQA